MIVTFIREIYGPHLQRITLKREMEIPFIPQQGMVFHDGDWECRAETVHWEKGSESFEVHAGAIHVAYDGTSIETTQAIMDDMADDYIDTGWSLFSLHNFRKP